MGEEGANCQLKGAIAVANPFDLEMANKALQRTLLGKQVYSRVMGCKSTSVAPAPCAIADSCPANMKRLINLHKDSVLAYTKLDFDRIQKVTYLHEFDREVQ